MEKGDVFCKFFPKIMGSQETTKGKLLLGYANWAEQTGLEKKKTAKGG